MTLPLPLVPADCDLSDVEPPWDLFVEMAIDLGGPPDEVRAFVAAQRTEWQRQQAEAERRY